jgi:hypothetical protein
MKKHVKKLSLRKQTVQLLGSKQQKEAVGGSGNTGCASLYCSDICSWVWLCNLCPVEKAGEKTPQ